MPGPQHGIVGDDNYGTDLPKLDVQPEVLAAEARAAKFSQSAEFKILKEHIEERIELYQKYLPDGRALTEVDSDERAQQWVIANAVIGEFQAILASYEQAQEVVKATARRG